METDRLILTGLTLATYWLNGLLAALYWLADHWAALAALAVAAAMIWLVDGALSRQAGQRARRYERGTVNLAARSPHLVPLGVALAWTLAAWITPPPVPQIGLAMWVGALVTPLTLPLGKRHIGHTLRWLIAGYTALLLLFWLAVRFPLSPTAAAAWSERLQTLGAGESLDWAIRAQIIPYATLLIWYIFPASYFGLIFQQFATQRRLLVNPWATVAERLAAWRNRGDA